MSNNSNVTSPPPITQTTQAANHINTCSNSHSIIQISMIVVVMAVSIIGNGAVCALLLRFKTLRTVPNILVANLALIDVVNACVNMPLFIMWYQCKVPYIGGPAVSWFTISFYVLFMNLTVVSLVVLMLDRYGAIVHGLRYHSWKTRNKALFSVFVIWFCACAYTYGQFAMGIHVDIGPQPAWMYRMEYFKIFGRPFVLTGYVVPLFVISILGILIWRQVRMSTIAISPQSSLGSDIKHRRDVATAKTVGLTILAYFWFGFFPVLLHSVAKIHGSWVHFFAYWFIHVSSMANPIIYSLRTQRFRLTLTLLLREPCGKSQPSMTSSSMVPSSGVTHSTGWTSSSTIKIIKVKPAVNVTSSAWMMTSFNGSALSSQATVESGGIVNLEEDNDDMAIF
ncbi:neuromedin-U receptor 2-like [Nematostella vectensis]|uniref:neuromedin-U receptor 2-like n=1 Tax=Nematostella vectensis TaxID=45351 RepID=UPI002076DAFC|nr:neuromedin-U receptor 2-like [Nematostella vectensis]